MREDVPAFVDEFVQLYRRVEHALTRNGYCREDRARAHADWRRFALSLGGDFFEAVLTQGKAATLIGEPPRSYHRSGAWVPDTPQPIEGVEALFTRGVCQVRHNIEHGQKYVLPENERSERLVTEALWVLRLAIESHKDRAGLFGDPPSLRVAVEGGPQNSPETLANK